MTAFIAFFSRKDENFVNGMIKNLEIGNTEVVARMIQQFTGAGLFQMEPNRPYAKNYHACVAEAQADQQQNARPALKQYPQTLKAYDTIYLGYPNYWGTMPMAVFTFLEHFDFAGKCIKPFCTHEGSGLGSSVSDIKRLCPGARVENGLAIHGSRIQASADEIKKWI